jgi:hypothetical protein
MTPLQLGDYVLDPAKFLYIPKLRALVCSGLQHALLSHPETKRLAFLEAFWRSVQRYPASSIVSIGALQGTSGLRLLRERFGSSHKLICVSALADKPIIDEIERLGIEFHKQLVWSDFRFKEANPKQLGEKVQMNVFTIASMQADHQPTISAFHLPFMLENAPVFLKGHGRLLLPSVSPNARAFSVLSPLFHSYDTFAVHRRSVLPLGKVR